MNIYVGNLSYSTTEDDLFALFNNLGGVDSARIITDRETGRSKGFGFVEMGSDNEAKSAIEELNGAEFGGRNITVNEAKPREEGGNRGGFNRGNSRGGGYGAKRY